MFHPSLDIIPALLKPAGVVHHNDLYSQLTNLLAYCQFHHERRKHVFKEKGWGRRQGDGKKHTDNMELWALQAFPLFIKDKKYEIVLFNILKDNKLIYVKASYYQIFACIIVRSWTGRTVATHITLKCRFALHSARHRILKLGHSPWGWWEL